MKSTFVPVKYMGCSQHILSTDVGGMRFETTQESLEDLRNDKQAWVLLDQCSFWQIACYCCCTTFHSVSKILWSCIFSKTHFACVGWAAIRFQGVDCHYCDCLQSFVRHGVMACTLLGKFISGLILGLHPANERRRYFVNNNNLTFLPKCHRFHRWIFLIPCQHPYDPWNYNTHAYTFLPTQWYVLFCNL